MKTYPEMDKEIVKLLDIEGTPFSVYDARCIEKLQAENAELRARLDKAEHRTEVAERALWTACVNLIKDEDNVDMELLAHVIYTHYLRKAENELTEEGKDG